MFALVFFFISSVQAANIVWVSMDWDNDGDGINDSQEWVDLLEAEGYTVDFQPGYWDVLTEDKVDELNAADLVIFSATIQSNIFGGDDPEESGKKKHGHGASDTGSGMVVTTLLPDDKMIQDKVDWTNIPCKALIFLSERDICYTTQVQTRIILTEEVFITYRDKGCAFPTKNNIQFPEISNGQNTSMRSYDLRITHLECKGGFWLVKDCMSV